MILFNDVTSKREILINPEHIVCAVRQGNETVIYLSQNASLKTMGVSMGTAELAQKMNEWYAAIHQQQ